MVKTIRNEWSENKNLVAKVSSNYFNKDTDGGDIENNYDILSLGAEKYYESADWKYST